MVCIISCKSCVSVRHLVHKFNCVPFCIAPIKRTEDGDVFHLSAILALVVHEKYTAGSYAVCTILWPSWLSSCGWSMMTLTAGLWFVIFNTSFSLHSFWAVIHHFQVHVVRLFHSMYHCWYLHGAARELLSQKLDMKFMSAYFISINLGIFCCSFLLTILLSISDSFSVTTFIQHVALTKLLQ